MRSPQNIHNEITREILKLEHLYKELCVMSLTAQAKRRGKKKSGVSLEAALLQEFGARGKERSAVLSRDPFRFLLLLQEARAIAQAEMILASAFQAAPKKTSEK